MIQFFPSNSNVSAAAQALYRGQSAEEVARIQAAAQAQAVQAQNAQLQQERYFRGQQQQQQNDQQRQQLSQNDFFNRGRLNNEQAQIAANLELAKSNAAAQSFWHQQQMQPRIDEGNRKAAEAAQADSMLATQVTNLAKTRNEYDRLTGDLSKLSALETAQVEQNKLPAPPSTAEVATLRKGYTVLGYDPFKEGYKPQATKADGTKIEGMDFGAVRTRMQDKLKGLADIIKNNQELTMLLAKSPDGSWVPSLPNRVAPSAQFFNAPAGSSAPQVAPTGGYEQPMMQFQQPTGRYFNSPAVGTNLPPIIKFDPRSGRPIAYDAVTKAVIGFAN